MSAAKSGVDWSLFAKVAAGISAVAAAAAAAAWLVKVHTKCQHKIRKAFVMQVNQGEEVEYERRHNPIWKELEQVLTSHGVSNYSIYLHPVSRQLFAYVELLSEDQWAAIADTDVAKRWFHHMSPIMATNDDQTPVMTPLKQVFHLD